MAAPTYFGSASNPADNETANEPSTLAVTPPASMSSGDLVLLIGLLRITTPSSAVAVSETGGQTWSSGSTVGSIAPLHYAVFWCQFNGTWTADPSLVFAAELGVVPTTAIMHVFRPAASGTWAVDTTLSGAGYAATTPVTITGITPANNDNVTLAAWAQATAVTWGTLSGSGWAVTGAAQYRNTAGADDSGSFAHQLQGTKAATGNVSLTPSSTGGGLKFTMAWYVIPGPITPSPPVGRQAVKRAANY